VTPPRWQRRRARFNHDWLKNDLLPALTTFRNILSGAARSASIQAHFQNEELAAWPARSAEARALAQSFTNQMSPKSLFATPPMNGMPDDTRKWLEPLVHQLWLSRTAALYLVDNAIKAIDEADGCWRRLQTALPADGAPAGQGALPAVDDFLGSCQALARSFEHFPRTVSVLA
jgi:hypothetical protein